MHKTGLVIIHVCTMTGDFKEQRKTALKVGLLNEVDTHFQMKL